MVRLGRPRGRRETPTYDPLAGCFTFVARQRIRSLTLACALDSLVRVPRRVELDRPNDVWVGRAESASEVEVRSTVEHGP